MRYGNRLPPRPATVAQSFERWCEAWGGSLPPEARDAFYAGALSILSTLERVAAGPLTHAQIVAAFRSLEQECVVHFAVGLTGGKPS